MVNPKDKIWAGLAFLLVDVIAIFIAFIVGQSLRMVGDFAGQPWQTWWQLEGQFRVQASSVALLVMVLFFAWRKRHYSTRQPFWDELAGMLHAIWLGVVVDGALMYFNKWQFSRLAFGVQWLSLVLLLPSFRVLLKYSLLRLQVWRQPIRLFGAGINAQEAWLALKSERLMGYQLAEIIIPNGMSAPTWAQNVKQVCWQEGLQAAQSQQVVVALEADQQTELESAVRILTKKSPNMLIVPPTRGLPLWGVEPMHCFSHEVLLLRAHNGLMRWPPRVLKRLFDIAVSSLCLLMFSPLFAWLIWQVKRTGGDAFFGHQRVSEQGKSFPCYKFRTMVPNAKEVLEELLRTNAQARAEWEREFKLKDDPRITTIGAFLRRTSLDELPQLWNVLRGDMSLVGPRPVIREELERYGEDVTYYLNVRPGMTGLWQVSGRNDVDYETRVALDAWYVRNWSLWNDIVILIKTVKVVLWRKGAY